MNVCHVYSTHLTIMYNFQNNYEFSFFLLISSDSCWVRVLIIFAGVEKISQLFWNSNTSQLLFKL